MVCKFCLEYGPTRRDEAAPFGVTDCRERVVRPATTIRLAQDDLSGYAYSSRESEDASFPSRDASMGHT